MIQKSIIRLLAMSIAAGLLLGVSPLGAQLTEDEKNTIDVVKKTKNSVVFVVNIQRVQDLFFFEQEVPRGSGSGFIWDDRGHIVTNFHVTEEGDKFSVSLPNQEQRQAKLVGYDPAKDIAVSKSRATSKASSPSRRAPRRTSRWARRSSPSAIRSGSTIP
jgi:S1-C subfamily serine protease